MKRNTLIVGLGVVAGCLALYMLLFCIPRARAAAAASAFATRDQEKSRQEWTSQQLQTNPNQSTLLSDSSQLQHQIRSLGFGVTWVPETISKERFQNDLADPTPEALASERQAELESLKEGFQLGVRGSGGQLRRLQRGGRLPADPKLVIAHYYPSSTAECRQFLPAVISTRVQDDLPDERFGTTPEKANVYVLIFESYHADANNVEGETTYASRMSYFLVHADSMKLIDSKVDQERAPGKGTRIGIGSMSGKGSPQYSRRQTPQSVYRWIKDKLKEESTRSLSSR